MSLTSKELTTIAELFAKASAEDMQLIADQYNYQRKMNSRKAASKFSVGDKVKWSGKNGKMLGVVKKVNPKNIVVITEFDGTWNVTASLLKAA
jgi:putative ribosome biogenesis GTPase RsgA